MATLRKRGDKWQVQVRRNGHPPISRSFQNVQDAKLWARQLEAQIDRDGLPVDRRRLQSVTLCELMDRYRDEVTSRKRGERAERYRLKYLRERSFSALPLNCLTTAIVTAWRNQREKEVGPQSLRHELNLLRHVLEVARRDWDIPLATNPVANLRVPAIPAARERRLLPGEEARLFAAGRRNKLAVAAVGLALETAMRRGELLGIRLEHVDFDRRTLLIPLAKNGQARTIALTQTACDLLKGLAPAADGRLLRLSANALKLAWERLKRRAGIDDLRFHDLRHEAISRFFERGLSVAEVALISGHRDVRMLFRYTHLRAEDIAKKLA